MLRYIVFKIGFAVKLIDTVSERSKETDLRSVGESLVGSIPTERTT